MVVGSFRLSRFGIGGDSGGTAELDSRWKDKDQSPSPRLSVKMSLCQMLPRTSQPDSVARHPRMYGSRMFQDLHTTGTPESPPKIASKRCQPEVRTLSEVDPLRRALYQPHVRPRTRNESLILTLIKYSVNTIKNVNHNLRHSK